MKYIDVIKYCLSKPDTLRVALNNTGTAFGFSANDKVFAYFETGAPVQWRLSLRVTDEHFSTLQHPPSVVPAKDKKPGQWLTIVRVENYDDNLLLELIDWSYDNRMNPETLNESVEKTT